MELKDKKISFYIRNGNLDMEKVVEDYTRYIHKIIKNYHTALTKEDEEEIVLDVFFTLWKNQNKLDWNCNISPYISGVTRNLIKKKFRNVHFNESIDDYEELLISESSIDLIYAEKEINKIIISSLEKMNFDDKNIFLLYYYEMKSIKEICGIMNISESKAKSKLFRVRKKLNKTLKIRGYSSND